MDIKELIDQRNFSFVTVPPICLNPFIMVVGNTLQVTCSGLAPLERDAYLPTKFVLIAKEDKILFALTLPSWMPSTYFDDVVRKWENNERFSINQSTYTYNDQNKIVGCTEISVKGITTDYYLITGTFDMSAQFTGKDILDIPVTEMQPHYQTK